jgi:NAD/NADP transhydrogenase beta subunit
VDFTDMTQYVNYVRLGILAVVILLAVIGAIRRSRPKAARRDLLIGILGVAAVAIMGAVASATSWLYVVVFLVVGLAIGFLLGGIRPLAAWIVVLTTVYFAMALLWDQGGSFAPGLGVLALGAGIPLGQGLRAKTPSTSQYAAAGAPTDAQPGA